MGTMRNSVMLIGNAGSDPEIRTFSNGQKVARVRIAVNESYLETSPDLKPIPSSGWLKSSIILYQSGRKCYDAVCF